MVKKSDEELRRKTFAKVSPKTIDSFKRVFGWGVMMRLWDDESEAFEAIIQFYLDEKVKQVGRNLPKPPLPK